MTRNLKVLFAAAMALAAFGAVSAGAAHAAEETFHCSVAPCTLTLNPDGTTTTAHHVFIVKNVAGEIGSITCAGLAGDATSETTTTETITTTALIYSNCKVNGVSESRVRMNECNYVFTSKVEGAGATIHVECSTSKHIEIETVPTGCIFEVTPQTLLGAHYHTFGSGSERETTVEVLVVGAAVEVAKAGTGCIPKAKVGETLTGEYKTGNTLVTAEKDNGLKEMVGDWWE